MFFLCHKVSSAEIASYQLLSLEFYALMDGRNKTPNTSRKLSWLLRHGATECGLSIRSDGFVDLDDIIALPQFQQVSRQEVRDIVDNDNKERFRLLEDRSCGKLFLRANQGHSGSVAEQINPESLLCRLTENDVADFPMCVHGTSKSAWASIKCDGLSKMRRQMIHMASGVPSTGGVISGMRKSSEVIIHIDLERAIQDGVPFYVSSNGVILSPGVEASGILPAKYFSEVTIP